MNATNMKNLTDQSISESEKMVQLFQLISKAAKDGKYWLNIESDKDYLNKRDLTTYNLVLGIVNNHSNMINRNKRRLRKYLSSLELVTSTRDYMDNTYVNYKSKEGIRIFSYKLSDRLVVTSQFLEDKFKNIDDRLYCCLVKDIISELYGLDINDIG
jgi:hypothetical protein